MCPVQDVAAHETIALRAFVEALLAGFEVQARARHVALDALVFSEELDADAELLRRLLTSLVGDALRRAPAGTNVSLVVTPRGRYTEFRVADEGAGAAVEAREPVFDPNPGGGAADDFGLTFSTLAAEANGGRLTVTETDAGTVVCLALPSQVATEAMNQPGTGGAAKGGQAESTGAVQRESGIYAQADGGTSLPAVRTVLLVDDEALVRTFIVRALKKKGYDVVEADCAERALEVLKANQPQIALLLSDVRLPGVSGAELVRQASLLVPRLPTLLMSATPKQTLVCEGLIERDTYLLQKPFAVADLLARVEELLCSSSPRLQSHALGSP